jgi:hypothetical protein
MLPAFYRPPCCIACVLGHLTVSSSPAFRPQRAREMNDEIREFIRNVAIAAGLVAVATIHFLTASFIVSAL